MNTIKVKVNFKKTTCTVTGITLVSGDYNSTEIKLTMDNWDGRNVFEMVDPEGNLVYAYNITNEIIPLYTMADVTIEHEGVVYIKYLDDEDNVYWYDKESDKLFDSEWEEISEFDLDDYTKVQRKASLFSKAGSYKFEISKYDENTESKLTSAFNSIKVRKEQIIIGDEIVTPYLPVFDDLIYRIRDEIQKCENLNIDVEKEGTVTTVTFTDKEGNDKTVEINDGEQGPQGEPGEGIIPGGTTGEVLKKKSNTDYDTEWGTIFVPVTSVNTKTGEVVLTASDILVTNSQTIQANLERMDEELGRLQDDKQDNLISAENIKTINGYSVLGSGNLVIQSGEGGLSSVAHDNTLTGSGTNENPLGVDSTKFATAAQGAKADSAVQEDDLGALATKDNVDYETDIDNKPTIPTKTSEIINDSDFIDSSYHDDSKQNILISGTNIKTINDQTLLGNGNIDTSIVKTLVGTQYNPVNLNTIDTGIYIIKGAYLIGTTTIVFDDPVDGKLFLVTSFSYVAGAYSRHVYVLTGDVYIYEYTIRNAHQSFSSYSTMYVTENVTGKISDLETTNKSNLVAAINELNERISNLENN